MTRITIFLIGAVLVSVLSGCTPQPRTVVALVDATASIDPEEYGRCAAELKRLVSRLGRGDRLILVPITGEPLELLGRRIVHIDMPAARVPYDSNLKQARELAASQVEEFLIRLPEIHAKQTDIIGALRAVSDEFHSGNSELICLSDMAQDDAQIRFMTSAELATSKRAEALARQLSRPGMLRGVTVRIGILKSFDLERMAPDRRDAVQAFWRQYFADSGAKTVRTTVDLENLSDAVAAKF